MIYYVCFYFNYQQDCQYNEIQICEFLPSTCSSQQPVMNETLLVSYLIEDIAFYHFLKLHKHKYIKPQTIIIIHQKMEKYTHQWDMAKKHQRDSEEPLLVFVALLVATRVTD